MIMSMIMAFNAGGNFEIKQSSHFLQAHAVLNLHIIHSSQATTVTSSGQDPTTPSTCRPPALLRA
jgi:hypothetical protein